MFYIGVDVGGTFTDVVTYDNKSGLLDVSKVPTTPDEIEKGIIHALAKYKDLASEVNLISHASTIATNALLTHTGLAKTALITNDGFRDILEIGRQRRADLYNLENKRPSPLVKRRDRFTVNGRILADGSELDPISESQVKQIAKKVIEENYDSIVVGFLNSYVNPKHESVVSKTLRKEGYEGHIDISSDVDKEYREYERFSTAVVNASLFPLVSRYLINLSRELRKEGFRSPIYVMNSDGSASTIGQASKYPILMIESGPAAGVLASRHVAKYLCLERILTFDMGGTTAKAGAIVDYEPDITYEFEAAGVTHSGRSIKGSGYPVKAPFIDLAEVSAGGGTIAYVDEVGALKVGPQSAGSVPGPAAYNGGGTEPTVTDANIVLGRINPDHLLGGNMKLRKDLARNTIKEKIARKMNISVEQSARGIISLVNNTMARAISIVSLERGRDPRDYSLFAFGGAGPMHACDLAEELEIMTIVIPPHAGLFSAYGLLTADIERNFSLPVMKDSTTVELVDYFEKLEEIAKKALAGEDLKSSRPKLFRFVEARYLGQSYEIVVPYTGKNVQSIEREFHSRHKNLYGYSSRDKVEIVNAKLRAVVVSRKPDPSNRREPDTSGSQIARSSSSNIPVSRRAWFGSRFYDALVFQRKSLTTGSCGKGPSIIEEYDSTAVINPSWKWELDKFGNLVLDFNS